MKLWKEYQGRGPREILLRLDMTESPVDPLVVATEIGVEVFLVKYNENNEKEGELNWEKADPQIYVNEKFQDKQRYIIAYFLGVLLGSDANIFAAKLLMPGWLVKYQVMKYENITLDELSKYFKVSKRAMNIRLRELNLDRWVN